MYERTFGRAQDELENDRMETLVWQAFIHDDVIYNIFGWGIAQYTFHVPGMLTATGIIPMQSGLVLTLTDFGLLGGIFLVCLMIFLMRYMKQCSKIENIYATVFSIAAVNAFVGALMYGNLITCFMYLMLSLYAYNDRQYIGKK